jgi:hypothetical protein
MYISSKYSKVKQLISNELQDDLVHFNMLPTIFD